MRPPRVLCVDDDRNILEAMRRSLKGDYELVLAVGGVEGLQKLREEGPFALLVTDLRMPVVDGVALLRQAAELSPDTVRVLLTGNGDMNAAVSAINEGQLFRLLTKPCPVKYLQATIAAGLGQHALLTSERTLLQETLCASMRSLADLACLLRPELAARVQRTRRLAAALGEVACPRDAWVCGVGMLLLSTASVTLPEAVIERAGRSQELVPSDRALLARLPELAFRLIAEVPRLEQVRESLGRLQSPIAREDAATVRVIRLLWDLEHEFSDDPAVTIEALRALGHDEELLVHLRELLVADTLAGPTVEVRLGELQEGMVLTESVFGEGGVLLIGRGIEVGPGLVERIRNYWNEETRARTTTVRATAIEDSAAA